jgi:hypothetical protein
MFRATSAHHQEFFSLLHMQPPVICASARPWHCLVVNNKTEFTRHVSSDIRSSSGVFLSTAHAASSYLWFRPSVVLSCCKQDNYLFTPHVSKDVRSSSRVFLSTAHAASSYLCSRPFVVLSCCKQDNYLFTRHVSSDIRSSSGVFLSTAHTASNYLCFRPSVVLSCCLVYNKTVPQTGGSTDNWRLHVQ